MYYVGGAIIRNNTCYDNDFYSNVIVDNGSGARDDNTEPPPNRWDSDAAGNMWSDFPSNPGYPSTYDIPVAAGSQDNYPQQASWRGADGASPPIRRAGIGQRSTRSTARTSR